MLSQQTTDNLNINIGHFASEHKLIEALTAELGELLPINKYTVDVLNTEEGFDVHARVYFVGSSSSAQWFPNEKIHRMIRTVYDIKPFEHLHIEKTMQGDSQGYVAEYDGERPY